MQSRTTGHPNDARLEVSDASRTEPTASAEIVVWVLVAGLVVASGLGGWWLQRRRRSSAEVLVLRQDVVRYSMMTAVLLLSLGCLALAWAPLASVGEERWGFAAFGLMLLPGAGYAQVWLSRTTVTFDGRRISGADGLLRRRAIDLDDIDTVRALRIPVWGRRGQLVYRVRASDNRVVWVYDHTTDFTAFATRLDRELTARGRPVIDGWQDA